MPCGRYHRRRAGLAQLVEQRFCKPRVGGSIPSAGTIDAFIGTNADPACASRTGARREIERPPAPAAVATNAEVCLDDGGVAGRLFDHLDPFGRAHVLGTSMPVLSNRLTVSAGPNGLSHSGGRFTVVLDVLGAGRGPSVSTVPLKFSTVPLKSPTPAPSNHPYSLDRSAAALTHIYRRIHTVQTPIDTQITIPPGAGGALAARA